MEKIDLSKIKRICDNHYETKEILKPECNKDLISFIVPLGIFISLGSLIFGALINQYSISIIGAFIGIIITYIGFKYSNPDLSSL
jgi:hypothetical protein